MLKKLLACRCKYLFVPLLISGPILNDSKVPGHQKLSYYESLLLKYLFIIINN